MPPYMPMVQMGYDQQQIEKAEILRKRIAEESAEIDLKLQQLREEIERSKKDFRGF